MASESLTMAGTIKSHLLRQLSLLNHACFKIDELLMYLQIVSFSLWLMNLRVSKFWSLSKVCVLKESYAQSIFLVCIELPDDAKCIKCND